MKLLKKPKRLIGKITVPGDKSISHRGIMFGAIANGVTMVKNFLHSADCLATLQAFEDLGIKILIEEEIVSIYGKGFNGLRKPRHPINVGNSGTTIRLLMGILAGAPFSIELTGDTSIQHRPMNRIILPLKEMGVDCKEEKQTGYPPLSFTGTSQLHAIHYTLPVASAQVKSALLFAALQAEGTSKITEKAKTRDHTERMIQQFGGNLKISQNTITLIGPQQLSGQTIIVPGDISSAAFFLAAGLLVPDSEIRLENVGINPTRTGILDVIQQMNGFLHISTYDSIHLTGTLTTKSSSLKAVTISGELIPRLIDELPIIALLATQAIGKTVIKDAEELKVKETNRIDAVAQELTKLGAKIQPTSDGLIVYGPTPLHGGKVSSRGDHRIAMMLQIAALLTKEQVELENAEVINVSYPNFFNDLQSVIDNT
ncbi:3-phosphoshikimate 1-carboxyvinyltransferase [Melissococcus plutonius]|uniref:3-phosphoshikimate 1-carboxyvinyltransferase n=1 Tax=Melissococcus plutonius TaxID=33970 RepID=A0A2Z5Y2B3_9ENTE|nr:3-phosphoshikimate 1-carboxyvinyltransferase [Melissococcus plutonius]BAL62112.1 5-enolpyruvylshikimate-3-phosphate synthase [Melissococcus plutonius DAT561]MCV2497878.1 3-phosphoshikimate 1-carboxyvinyltransferase [Melissococcus plutonius]MCV2500515.1 3-phosphoshikimate 1-carboxyvinyltransferase [Melissococcus plutonius]MCV2505217.1 3-phosphoshikimate 1-carboxyvinyltransferase [Melissococcus plutonius]MCV2506493.1 3-phosphoshikimate 1-carboxyvinyltransferase [Melissococcus plutonius]